MATEPPIGSFLLGPLMLCVLVAVPGAASAKSCTAPKGAASVKIELADRALSRDTTQGLKALTRKMKPDEDPTIKSLYSFGLTSVQWRSSADLQLKGVPVGATSYCWYVDAINMKIDMSSTVFVAKEIDYGTCPWREVLKHEDKHVALNKKMFARLPGDLKPKVDAVAKGGILTTDGNAALATFRPKIEKAIDKALNGFSDARERQHIREIDTKAEYQRVDAACPEAEWDAVFRRAGLK